MATAATNPKQEAHELIERISTAQASAVVTLITTMLDPVDRAIANAPFEDEPISDEENRAVAASKAWLAEHPGEGIPHEEMLASSASTPKTSTADRLPHVKKIIFTPAARADVRRIDRDTAMRILTALDRFARTGEGDIKKLEGNTNDLRLRVGDYRVRFIENPPGTLYIHAVLHRSEAYR